MTSSNPPLKSVDLADDEYRLIRLFRRMDLDDQSDTLIETTQRLMKKYSVDPHLGRFTPAEQTLQQELDPENVEKYDERLLAAWPGHWPGRKLADLDDVGDAGFFLQKKLEQGASYYILGTSEFDHSHAEYLADSYLEEISDQGLPAYRDFCEPDTEEEREKADQLQVEDTVNEFVGFFREWRERVIRAIEKQSHK